MTTQSHTATDFRRQVTERVINLMEHAGSDWKRPWVSNGLHRNFITKKPYRGINMFLTGMSGFDNPHWGTYGQLQAKGVQVRKGEKATHIVFWKPLTVKDKDTNEEKDVSMMKTYTVFNLDQCDNAPNLFIEPRPIHERHAECDDLIAMTGARISHCGDRAFYQPSTDTIRLPEIQQFNDAETYFSTAFHELGHWSGHPTRLDRKLTGKFGDTDYAFEELIAEFTAAILCAVTGISAEPRDDHARYLNSWKKGFRENPSFLFMAAGRAQKAADFIAPPRAPEPEAEPSRPGGSTDAHHPDHTPA